VDPDARLAAELLGVGDWDEYLQAASELLLHLFPGGNVAWNDLDAGASRAEVGTHPEQPGDFSRIMLELWADHPIIISYVNERGDKVWEPRRLSEFVMIGSYTGPERIGRASPPPVSTGC
jgi:hypothetical protein